MILMPLLIVAFLAFLSVVFRHTDPFPGIVWNDEAVYLKLIQTYSHYPSPLGYFGFDGNHAILGSGPAWNPAILWPYLLPALVFPTGQHFVFFVNLFYLILANVLFYLLAKPDRDGNFDIKVGFSEPRSDGDSNAKIATILEYGKSGQPARPFLKPARSASKSACIRAMKEKLEEEIESI